MDREIIAQCHDVSFTYCNRGERVIDGLNLSTGLYDARAFAVGEGSPGSGVALGAVLPFLVCYVAGLLLMEL